MNPDKAITVETIVNAPLEKVWESWVKPEHITRWTFASDDWEAPEAQNDIRVGGKFKTVMAAKDKSAGFDFTGEYTNVREHSLIEYTITGGREVKIEFLPEGSGVKVVETFEMENENSRELQQSGWQAILENFKKYTEKNYRQ